MRIPARQVTWTTVVVVVATCAVLYGFIFNDALTSKQWIHVMTLTPLMPFLVVLGLAYRHRANTFRAALLLGFSCFLTAVFMPVFWHYFTSTADHVVKALVKGALPIGATLLTAIFGAWLEWQLRSERRNASSTSNSGQQFERY